MPGIEHLIQTLAHFAGAAVISGLWQGTILAATLWLCLRLVPNVPASLRFALWTAVLFLIPLLSLLENHASPSAYRSLVHADPRWSLALAALWLLLSAVRGCSLAVHGLQLCLLHNTAIPMVLPQPLQLLLTLPYRRVQLCTSTRLGRPGVIGFFAPRILIPAWLYAQLSAPELEQIVLHEVEHLRRGDDWLNLLQKLALVLFPLNPILIAIERLLCRERELACDDGVLRRTRSPRAYAATLATLAERDLNHRDLDHRRLASRTLSLALSALGSLKETAHQSELARRVYRILRGEAAASPLHAVAVSVTVPLILLAGAAGLARCPQPISFATPAPFLATEIRSPERWVSSPGASPILYTDTAKRYLLQTSLQQPRKPIRKKIKTNHVKPAHVQRAYAQPIQPAPPPAFLATETFIPAPTPTPLIPTLVRYTLVRVEGGWLLLQL